MINDPSAPDANEIVRKETCSVSAVRRIAAMLDVDTDEYKEGGALPLGWHFILLAGDTRRSQVRGDGFPGLGVPIPDLGLPRLLLGSRTVDVREDLIIGSNYDRHSWVDNIVQKEGKAGPMAIVSIAHDLVDPLSARLVLHEVQTYILLGTAPYTARQTPQLELPEKVTTIVPDDILLFQYSALGFNSHKIHLDRAYAMDVEGYPDIVVNGGLSSLLLLEHLRKRDPRRAVKIVAKHHLPLFSGKPIHIRTEDVGGGLILKALDYSGALSVEIHVEF
jgi:3-methylfumaryl-CoA hydratase